MNCSRVRRSLPLLAGNDLTPAQARRLERHLARCPDCRQEAAEIRAALAAVRTAAAQETFDWPEAEWKALIARVNSERMEPRRRPFLLPAPAPRSWAYAAALILIVGAALLILKIIPSKPGPAGLTETLAATPVLPPPALSVKEALAAVHPQDRPYMIHPRQETLGRVLLAAGAPPEKPTQDMMSMTLVSQKTGLQVHWTLNRNFDWEEKKK